MSSLIFDLNLYSALLVVCALASNINEILVVYAMDREYKQKIDYWEQC